MTFAAPRDQRDFLTKAATSDKEKERICPSIPDGYFLDFQLNHLDKFLRRSSGSTVSDCPRAASLSSNTPQNSVTENARQTPRKEGTAIQQSTTAATKINAQPPQLPQTPTNPRFVARDGRCGIRTIMFILTQILGKTFVVSD